MSSEILVLAEHDAGDVRRTTLELLTLAAAVGRPVVAWLGDAPDHRAEALMSAHGAGLIVVLPDHEAQQWSVGPKVTALAHLVETRAVSAVLVAGSAEGREIAARLAVRTRNGILTDVTAIDGDLRATQAIFGGAVTVRSQVTSPVAIMAVRPGAVVPAQVDTSAEVIATSAPAHVGTEAAIVEWLPAAPASRPDPAEADIVVAAGRGAGSAEGFAVVEQLADVLGAGVGASRAATDAGWYPHRFQIGQTGKTISPNLYIAAGISGAIQHRAGMQTSKTIVAINSDPDAPIFELADLGIVGDMHTVIPQLIESVEAGRTG